MRRLLRDIFGATGLFCLCGATLTTIMLALAFLALAVALGRRP